MTVTYETTRWQWMTWLAKDGSIFSDQLVDTQDETDVRNLADAQRTAAGRVFVRPASVAVVTGYGPADVGRVDAVYANGSLLNGRSGLHKGDGLVTIVEPPVASFADPAWGV